jgi:hypothetical protein
MLDMAFGLTDTSRLGCQVYLTRELDGMVVKIPSATRNMFVDGLYSFLPGKFARSYYIFQEKNLHLISHLYFTLGNHLIKYNPCLFPTYNRL